MLDKIKGCIFGGAIGDALGYTIEFYKEDEIFEIYGKNGICEYELVKGIAPFSDDTQMSLFTAEGLLLGDDYLENIRKAYIDWYHTQLPSLQYQPFTKLYKDKRLHENRAPGMACMNSLYKGGQGSISHPINDSKGCGGVMRVAPIGCYFKKDSKVDAGLLAAQASALTHGHELGYLPSAFLTYLIQEILESKHSLEDCAYIAKYKTSQCFKEAFYLNDFELIIDQVIQLANSDLSSLEAIHELGEGWVAEEALAIALYCALKYSNDFEKAITTSINHKGDSDSTGAICGNILGAYVGYSKIPHKYLQHLECTDLLDKYAQDLSKGRI